MQTDWTSTLARTVASAVCAAAFVGTAHAQEQSVARRWNELLLESIRNDYARPTVHARNLYHVSMAMWDAWAAFSPTAEPILFQERYILDSPEPAREEAISYAAYRLLNWRFQNSQAYAEMRPQYDASMARMSPCCWRHGANAQLGARPT